ncbi:hypothetical protein C8J57DRAFT_1656927 [Mycena rebaudengoi]|nr:hypothetical protein C8J57DRAFT_1656927 [Mycena rebaudengoi]
MHLAPQLTVYLAGASVMTASGTNNGTMGPQFLPELNNTRPRSAREGRFTAMAANIKAGDYVVIEFGHKDGEIPTPTDKTALAPLMCDKVHPHAQVRLCLHYYHSHTGSAS